jgi:transcriptional regulator with XRE-family HTH domain
LRLVAFCCQSHGKLEGWIPLAKLIRGFSGVADDAGDFAYRLDLALKALNLSRAHLAAAVEVDKSVVSRWLSGRAMPSGLNLARISEALAKTRPGFSAIAWNRPLGEFEALLGIPASPASAKPRPKVGLHPPDPDLPPDSPLSIAAHSFQNATEAARREIGRHGDAYDGFWEVFRPSFMVPGKFIRDQAIIHRRDGLLHMRQGSQGFEYTGWLMMLRSQIYGLLADLRDDGLVLSIVNSVNMPRVESTNGLMMAVTSDKFQTPTASPILWRRAGDLSGDEEKDRRTYDDRRASIANLLEPETLEVRVRQLLTPEIGPKAFAAGGELLLRALFDPAISHGTPTKLPAK